VSEATSGHVGPGQSGSQVINAGPTSSVCRSSSTAPDQAHLQIVNVALRELGIPAIQTKSDVAKKKAADIKRLVDYLQGVHDFDPETGESMDLLNDNVMVDGVYAQSKSGNLTAADMKDGMRRFLAG